MSFEVYAMSGENPSPRLPFHGEFLAAFGNAVQSDDGGFVRLVYDSGLCDVFYSVHEFRGEVIGFVINRPASDAELWKSVFNLLTRYHFYLVWPGDCGPVLGRSDTMLPEGLADELGQPILVETAQKIPALIEAS